MRRARTRTSRPRAASRESLRSSRPRTDRARARPIEDSREQPLAGARLPFDQHGRHPAQFLRALDQPPELVAHSLDPGALAEELGHRAHRAPHVTPTGQLGVQTLTTRTPLTTALSGRNSLIPCEFPLGTGIAYCDRP